jgi:hypothetical protein
MWMRIDVAIVHTERGSNEHGVMYLFIASALLPRPRDVGFVYMLSALLYFAGDSK